MSFITGVVGTTGKAASGYNLVSVINHFGPFLLTNLLLDKMTSHAKKRPVRIINVSSIAYGYSLTPEVLFTTVCGMS